MIAVRRYLELNISTLDADTRSQRLTIAAGVASAVQTNMRFTIWKIPCFALPPEAFDGRAPHRCFLIARETPLKDVKARAVRSVFAGLTCSTEQYRITCRTNIASSRLGTGARRNEEHIELYQNTEHAASMRIASTGKSSAMPWRCAVTL